MYLCHDMLSPCELLTHYLDHSLSFPTLTLAMIFEYFRSACPLTETINPGLGDMDFVLVRPSR